MDLFNIQFIVFAAIGLIVLVGVIFVVQDARAHRRHQESYTNRARQRQTTRTAQREHEPA